MSRKDNSSRCIVVWIRRKEWPRTKNLVRGKDQSKLLYLSFALEFGENELVKRQEERSLCRNLNA